MNLKTPEELQFDQPFQNGKLCGVHALYVALKAAGFSVSYDELVRRCRIGPKGASISELKEVAEQDYGFRFALRKQVPPDDLLTVKKPVIVHLNSSPRSGSLENHFIVITGRNQSGWLSGVDTTNGQYTAFDPAALARNMSGYCLIPEEHQPNAAFGGQDRWPIAIIGVLVSLNATVFVFGQRLTRGKPQASLGSGSRR